VWEFGLGFRKILNRLIHINKYWYLDDKVMRVKSQMQRHGGREKSNNLSTLAGRAKDHIFPIKLKNEINISLSPLVICLYENSNQVM